MLHISVIGSQFGPAGLFMQSAFVLHPTQVKLTLSQCPVALQSESMRHPTHAPAASWHCVPLGQSSSVPSQGMHTGVGEMPGTFESSHFCALAGHVVLPPLLLHGLIRHQWSGPQM